MAKFSKGETVTRLRATTTSDGYGGTVLDWTTPTEATIEGVALAPRTGEEIHGPGRAGVIIGFTLYCDYDADITYEDRIRRADGAVYEFEGQPGQWDNPFSGYEHGMTGALRRVEG